MSPTNQNVAAGKSERAEITKPTGRPKRYRCKKCGVVGHFAKKCEGPETMQIRIARDEAMRPLREQRRALRAERSVNRDEWDRAAGRRTYDRQRGQPNPVVYVVQLGVDGPVKIGWTTALTIRLKAYRHYSPWEPIVVRTWPGSRKDERDLQAKVARWHLRGEWFDAQCLVVATEWTPRC